MTLTLRFHTNVTVPDRDSTDQKRVAVADLVETMAALRDGELAFDELSG